MMNTVLAAEEKRKGDCTETKCSSVHQGLASLMLDTLVEQTL